MTIRSVKSRTFSTNSLFAAFSQGIIGWGLLHAWGLSVRTGLLFHALAALPGLVLTGVVLYRYRRHWPVDTAARAARQRQGLKCARDYRAVASWLMMVGIGFVIALLIGGGSLFALALAAMGMVFVPWTKIAVSRDHFFFASALLGAGALVGLVVLGRPDHPMGYLLAAWLLSLVACMVLMSVIAIHGNRLDRMPASGYQQPVR